MIQTLLRYDPRHRLLIFALVFAALPGLAFASIYDTEVPLDTALITILLVQAGVMTHLIGCMTPCVSRRQLDLFLLTLPVEPRAAARADLVLAISIAVLPVIAAGVSILLPFRTVDVPVVAPLVLCVGSSTSLAATASTILARRFDERRITFFLPALLILIAGLATSYHLSSWWLGGVMGSMACLGIVYAWKRGHSWVAMDDGSSQSRFATGASSPSQSHAAKGTKFAQLSTVQLLVWTLLIGFVFTSSSTNVIWLPYAWLALHQYNHLSSQITRRIGHLPISRFKYAPRVILLPIVLGLLAVIALAPWMTQLFTSAHYDDVGLRTATTSSHGETAYYINTKIPRSLRRVSLGYEQPSLTSPTGESHPLSVSRSYSWAPVASYNPYEIPSTSSVEFAAWQVSRLARDVFGLQLDSKLATSRFLQLGDNGLVQARKSDSLEVGSPQNLREYLRDKPRAWTQDLLLGKLLLVVALWYLVGRRSFRPVQYPQAPLTRQHLMHHARRAIRPLLILLVAITIVGWTNVDIFVLASLKGLGSVLPQALWLALLLIATLVGLLATQLMFKFNTMDCPSPPRTQSIHGTPRRSLVL